MERSFSRWRFPVTYSTTWLTIRVIVLLTGQLIGVFVFAVVNHHKALGIYVVSSAKRSSSHDAKLISVIYEPKKIEMLGYLRSVLSNNLVYPKSLLSG
jgi:hypothetical protein